MSESSSQSCEKKPGRSFLLIVVGLLFFGGLTAWVLCSYKMNHPSYDQARAVERAEKLAELKKKEAEILDHYAVVDEVKGIYRVPIARAMELTAEELKNKPVRTAGVIPAK